MRIAIAGATGLVGTELTHQAEAAGHEVVPLSRSHGIDLTRDPVDLSDTDAVVDVTSLAGVDPAETQRFFEAVGRTLAASGAPRKVLLSIIGVDRTASEFPYYAAKLAHEQAYGGDVHLVRAAQFEQFPEQMLEWYRRGDAVEVFDAPVQLVAVRDVAAALLAVATGADDRRLVEVAGPEVAPLPDLVRRVAPPEIEVVVVEAGPAIAGGALLPGVA